MSVIVTLFNFSQIEKRENHIFFMLQNPLAVTTKDLRALQTIRCPQSLHLSQLFGLNILASSEIFHLSQLLGLFTLTRSQILDKCFLPRGVDGEIVKNNFRPTQEINGRCVVQSNLANQIIISKLKIRRELWDIQSST